MDATIVVRIDDVLGHSLPEHPPRCLLQLPCAQALASVQAKLIPAGLSLIVFGGYRPFRPPGAPASPRPLTSPSHSPLTKLSAQDATQTPPWTLSLCRGTAVELSLCRPHEPPPVDEARAGILGDVRPLPMPTPFGVLAELDRFGGASTSALAAAPAAAAAAAPLSTIDDRGTGRGRQPLDEWEQEALAKLDADFQKVRDGFEPAKNNWIQNMRVTW